MTQVNNAKMLKVAQFFIVNHQFQTLNVDNRQDELWLFKTDSTPYDLIRISCKNIDQVTYEAKRLEASIKVIKESLTLQGHFLDIHISNDEILDKEEFDSVALETNYYSGIELSAYYPGIKEVMNNPIENPQEEIKRLSFDLMKRNRNRQSKRSSSLAFKPIATYTIMAICFVIFLLSYYLKWLQPTIEPFSASINSAILLGGFYKELIVIANEYWRFLTSGFVHVEIWHILMNMYALFSLGIFFERNYGAKSMLIILLGSIVGGSIFVFLGTENGVTVGISGGLYGLMASMIVHLWYTGLLKQPAIRSQVISLLAINIFITFMPGISMLGHIGGFITGLLLSMTLIKDAKLKNFINNAKISLAIGLVVVSYFIIKTDDVYPRLLGTDKQVIELARTVGLDFYADHLTQKVEDFYSK